MGGTLLGTHRLPILSSSTPSHPQPHLHTHLPHGTYLNPSSSPDTNGTVTSLALDGDYVVIGLANSNIKVYSARTGVLVRTLRGHESGVWGVCLVTRGGWLEGRRKGKGKRQKTEMVVEGGEQNLYLSETIGAEMRHALGLDEEDPEPGHERSEGHLSDSDRESDNESDGGCKKKDYKPGRPSFMSFSSIGWGQPNSIIVSGGCDKVLKVWDSKSGYAIPFHIFFFILSKLYLH